MNAIIITSLRKVSDRIIMAGKLTTRQKAFAELYDGNAKQAAIKVGYSEKTAYSQGQRLLKNVEVMKAVQAREENEASKRIATRQQRQEFWSDVMGDGEAEMKDRLKASELLGRSEGDFLERHDHSGSGFDSSRPLRVEFVTSETSQDGTEDRPDRRPGG